MFKNTDDDVLNLMIVVLSHQTAQPISIKFDTQVYKNLDWNIHRHVQDIFYPVIPPGG